MDPEEQQLRKSIDKEKHVYKENFTKLRELKSAIEHIQKLLEKSRVKMQTDFDAWYKHCVDFVDRYGSGAGRGQAKADDSVSSERTHVSAYGRGDRGQENESMNTTMASQRSPAAQPKPAPAQAQLTGNKEADDDIAAFFKAKEELLRRNAQAK